MTTIEKPRSVEQIKEHAYGVPADPTSKTGYCTSYNHKRCPYRPGGACENGIALSDGGFYMCPCNCHAEQADAVQANRIEFAAASTIATLDAHKAELEEIITAQTEPIEQPVKKAKAERPAKSPKVAKAPKAAAPSIDKLSNGQKQAMRYEMAALLRSHFNADSFPNLDGTALEGITPELAIAYLEDHWLQYVDPDKDKARREAAAAARKAK